MLLGICFHAFNSTSNLLLFNLIPLSEVGTTYFLWCCDKDYFYDRPPAWRQPSLKLEWVITTANAAGTNGWTCLLKHGGARDNKFWSSILWLTIENCAYLSRSHAERTAREAIELHIKYNGNILRTLRKQKHLTPKGVHDGQKALF
jgi:hypothetical protein